MTEPMKLETLQELEAAIKQILFNFTWNHTEDPKSEIENCFAEYRNSSATQPPEAVSQTCSGCADLACLCHYKSESATNVRELAERIVEELGEYWRSDNTWDESDEAVDRVAALIEASSLKEKI